MLPRLRTDRTCCLSAGRFGLWAALVACQAAPGPATAERIPAIQPTDATQASEHQGGRAASSLQEGSEALRSARREVAALPTPGPCRIAVERAQLREVTVSVADLTFSVNLDDVPLELQLEAGEPRARVESCTCTCVRKRCCRAKSRGRKAHCRTCSLPRQGRQTTEPCTCGPLRAVRGVLGAAPKRVESNTGESDRREI